MTTHDAFIIGAAAGVASAARNDPIETARREALLRHNLKAYCELPQQFPSKPSKDMQEIVKRYIENSKTLGSDKAFDLAVQEEISRQLGILIAFLLVCGVIALCGCFIHY